MRGVFQKKGSENWWIRYTDKDGKRHRESIGAKRLAEAALIDRRRQLAEDNFIPPAERRRQGLELDRLERQKRQELTFAEVYLQRMQAMQGRLSRGTFRNYQSKMNSKFFDALRTMPVATIRKENIDQLLASLYAHTRTNRDGCEEHLGASTVIGYRSLAGAVLAYAQSLEQIESNPVRRTHPPKPPKDRVRFLSAEEEVAIRRQLREKWPDREAELDLLLHTGMRIGELWHLTWDRVHPERGIISVPKEGKTGWRDVPMNSVARAAIHELHANSRGSEFVVPNAYKHRGEKYMASWLGQAAAAAGVLKVSAHTLRHTFASRLVMAGVNLKAVQELLGHSDIETTMRYIHLSPEHGHSAVEKLVAPPMKPPVRARTAAAAARPPIRVGSVRRNVAKIA